MVKKEEYVTKEMCKVLTEFKIKMMNEQKEDMADIKEKLDKFIELIMVKMSSHDTKVDNQDRKIDILSRDIQKISGDINQLNTSVGEIRTKLIADSDDLKMKCIELEKKINVNENNIIRLASGETIIKLLTSQRATMIFLMACVGITLTVLLIIIIATGNLDLLIQFIK